MREIWYVQWRAWTEAFSGIEVSKVIFLKTIKFIKNGHGYYASINDESYGYDLSSWCQCFQLNLNASKLLPSGELGKISALEKKMFENYFS